ncbi:flagellar M-ring protein FliF [Evansella sp. LMS18]|uniref:flagellar basal-body MS-ring/collar protein FliF n=1 Tax=Evansella sp. LMS18 TaxID=2924033 RepID=UPI0020D0D54E|nr:flagellar basal-body MS-ring/collar protein FliF [Evansella sp. LMS18]UTR10870.1 flagellar M-ring protein FliF [Evansella sp. LMS18]
MNEKLTHYKNKTIETWRGRSKNQRIMIVSAFLIMLLLLLVFMWSGSRTSYVPLYTNLTVQETGEIKATLDSRGIPTEVNRDGTAISVPEGMVDDLKVTLAAEGIPRTGRIDYSTFSENMGFGTTENEFNLLERAAIQTSIEDLIRNIDGVQASQVMVTMPEESIWLSDEPNQATASVLLTLQPGYQLDQKAIRALHHLVSRSVPNLPVENIVIMDQNFQYLELNEAPDMATALSVYEQQRKIQRDIEKDLQRQVQQMLGTIIGHDKVVVAVSTDLDFTQENRQEQLVTPVDEESMSGISLSVERITETYTGEEVPEGGVPGTGETDIPGYPGAFGAGSGDYERIEERINDEVNRIQRDIVESPYKIRDIGIQVMVEPPDPEDQLTLPPERLNDIQQILGQIVRTSIDSEYSSDWGQEDIEERIFVSSQQFFGRADFEQPEQSSSQYWLYAVIFLVLLIVLLLFLLFRKKRSAAETEFEEEEDTVTFQVPEIDGERETEGKARKRQLEKLAKEKPEEFSKLVRTWLSED